MTKKDTTGASAPDWLHEAIFYQIFPDRFANGDPSLDPPDVVAWDSRPTRTNFFGGDFLGIEQHLDHIVGLGANALYLNPVFQAGTNHRYDTEDYFAIDQRLGDRKGFGRFLAAAHQQGVKVVLDAVLNHCGAGHPYFADVTARETQSAYVVAEEWREPEQWLQGDRCDGTMNYTMRALLLGFTADRQIDAYELAQGMNQLRDRIPAGFRHGMLNLLGSHGTERVLTRHRGHRGRCLLSHALMFASQGAPMVYYGDEIGLRGPNDPGCRAAMPWDETVWNQRMLESLRSLAKLRSTSVPLRRGSQDYVALDPDTVMVVRDLPDERVVMVAHRGDGVRLSPESIPLERAWTLLSSGADGLRLGRGGFTVLTGRPAMVPALVGSSPGTDR